MVDDYIKRKNNEAEIQYWHPKLEQILQPTHGVILYQEQVMQIARELSGYTLGAADILRRAMGKKLAAEMAKQRNIFIKGAVERGVEQRVAKYVFDLIEHFAGYGFNKAHSTAYALVAYHTAWFKTHYPAAFMAAVLSADMASTDKVSEMIYECRALGLDIRPPDVNYSQSEFSVVDDKTVLYGLGAVRTVGAGMVQCILKEREANGLYRSSMDFCMRNIPHKVRKNTIEPLLQAGALDDLGRSRPEMLSALDVTYARAEAAVQDRLVGQSSLFGADDGRQGAELASDAEVPLGEPRVSHEQALHLEKQVLGVYLSEHPAARFAREIERMTKRQLKDEDGIPAFDGRREQAPAYRLAGIINEVKRGGMRKYGARFTLDDGTQRVAFGIYDDTFNRYKSLLKHDGVVIVEGIKVLDPIREVARWRANRILTLDEARREFGTLLLITLNSGERSAKFSERLKDLLNPYTNGGRCPVRVRLNTDGAYTELELGNDWRVKPCDELLHRMAEIDDVNDVSLAY